MVRFQEEARPIDIYDIQIMPEAQRGFSAVSTANRRLISDAIDELALNPRPDTSKLINNAASLRRLTVGDYRVIYGIAEAQKTVIIELIRHKSMVLMALAALALEVRVKNFSP